MRKDELEASLLRLGRRHKRQAIADHLLRQWFLAGIGGILAVILIRFIGSIADPLMPVVWIAVLTLPIVSALGLIIAGIPTPSRSQLAAEIDLLAGTQGLAMALAEDQGKSTDIKANWQSTIDHRLLGCDPPPIKWRGLKQMLAVIMLLALAPLLPARQPTDLATGPSPAEHLLQPLKDQLTRLKEEEAIPEPALEQLEEELSSLEQQGQDGVDQHFLRAIDKFSEQIDQETQSSLQALAEAIMAAEAAQGNFGQADQEMAQALQELNQRFPGAMDQLNGKLANDLFNKLTPQQQDALRNMRNQNPGQGQWDPAAAQKFAQQLREELLNKGDCLGCKEGLLGMLRQGKGGINRGPGHADLDLSHLQQDTDANKMDTLPNGPAMSNEGAIVIEEVQRPTPIDEATKNDLQRGETQTFNGTLANANRSTVSPRHRAAVGAWFNRDSDAAPSEKTQPNPNPLPALAVPHTPPTKHIQPAPSTDTLPAPATEEVP